MSDDRRVTRRSNRECRDIAARTKTFYVKERRWPVNIRKILNSGKIQTLRGERALVYDVVDDHLLGDKDATTELVKLRQNVQSIKKRIGGAALE